MRWTCVLCLLVSLAACKYDKETVPVKRDKVAVRVPNQQRIVALAVEEAIESLDFQALAGKTVSLEMNGVFPHSNEDLLDYIMGRIVGKLSRAGAVVVPDVPVVMVPGLPGQALGTGTISAGSASPAGMLTLTDPPDFRLVVGVSWGGLDTRDKVRTNEDLLTKQLGLGVGGLLAGLVLFSVADSTNGNVLATMSTFGAPIGAAVWTWKRSPFQHTYTLLGRVRVVVDGLPVKGGTAFKTEGKGVSKIVVDETVNEGFMLTP